MTPAVSFAIMHLQSAPERRAWATALCRQIQRDAPCVVVKDIKKRLWDTAKRAWMLAPRLGCTHHCVLQDDIVLCKDFVAGLVEAITARPEHPIGLFCPRKALKASVIKNDSWFVMSAGVWGQGNVLPVAMAADFIQWERANVVQDGLDVWDDRRLGMYCVMHDRDVWLTVPSLVNHAGHDRSTHLPGGGAMFKAIGRERVASVWTGESALDVDWSAGLAHPIIDTSDRNYPKKHAKMFKGAQ